MSGAKGRVGKAFKQKKQVMVSVPTWLRHHLKSEEVENQSKYIEEALLSCLPAAWFQYDERTKYLTTHVVVDMFSLTPLSRRVKMLFFFHKDLTAKLQSIKHPGVFIERAVVRYYDLPYKEWKYEFKPERKPRGSKPKNLVKKNRGRPKKEKAPVKKKTRKRTVSRSRA